MRASKRTSPSPGPSKPRRQQPTPAAPGNSKITLDMVAQAAGVSPSTVSRILNGTAVVNEAKRQAVDEAVAALRFVPNPVARGLAGGRTLSIGVVTQALDSPFYGGALRGIEDELARAGYSPLFVSGTGTRPPRRAVLTCCVRAGSTASSCSPAGSATPH